MITSNFVGAFRSSLLASTVYSICMIESTYTGQRESRNMLKESFYM